MLPFRDNVPRRSLPLVTWLLILVNAVVFWLELKTPPAELVRFLNERLAEWRESRRQFKFNS